MVEKLLAWARREVMWKLLSDWGDLQNSSLLPSIGSHFNVNLPWDDYWFFAV